MGAFLSRSSLHTRYIERLTPRGGVQLIWGDKFVRTYFVKIGGAVLPAGLLLPRCCTFLAAVWYWGAAVLTARPGPPGPWKVLCRTHNHTVGHQSGRIAAIA